MVDFWGVILLVTVLAAFEGWMMSLFTNCVLWFCDWQDNGEADMGLSIMQWLAVPLAWVFSIVEVCILHSK
jgi:hypothetical protein